MIDWRLSLAQWAKKGAGKISPRMRG
jgi:hypothetical protein